MAERLQRATQENILVLLCFDDEHGLLVRNLVSSESFEGLYRNIAEEVYRYIDKYEETPKNHTADLFADILESKGDRRAKSYDRILTDLYDNRSSVNPKYTLDSIAEWTRTQSLKRGVLEAAELLSNSTSGSLDNVEFILNKALSETVEIFDTGTFLSDFDRSLKFLRREDGDYIYCGIKELDKYEAVPALGQLHLLMALYNRGKSWWLVHLGKQALLQRKKICHITLEMSESEVSKRYIQSMFGISKRDESLKYITFELDSLDRLNSFNEVSYIPKLSFENDVIYRKLQDKINKFNSRFLKNLIIKQFPTGSMTISNLEGYLDQVKQYIGFVPDLLLVDYVDIMKMDANNFRLDLKRTAEELRGIAIKRNLAVATVTQSNRGGEKAKVLSGINVSEDFSKMATADTVITYNQTEQEQLMGLAQLYVAKARGDKARYKVLISQNYATGQFALDSYYMEAVKVYEELIGQGLEE